MRKVTLSVNLNVGFGENITFCKDFKREELYEMMEPVHQVSCLDLASLATPPKEVKRIYRLRDSFARHFASEISELILDALKRKDTLNGYLIEKVTP